MRYDEGCMRPESRHLFTDQYLPWLVVALCTMPLLSIAATNILLAAALIWCLWRVRPLRFPPIGSLVLAYFAGTCLSLLISEHWQQGWPQIRKFWVWAIALVAFSVLSKRQDWERVVIAWACAAAASSLWSIGQFARKFAASGGDTAKFYRDYVADRTTGAMSHWMTFSGEQMIVLAFVFALLLIGSWHKWRWMVAPAIILTVGILLNQTRNVWLAVLVAAVYLLAVERPKLLPLVPILALGIFLVAPSSVKQRMESIWKPDQKLDSNQHRVVTFQTGIRMIQSHPFFGLGPERIGPEFNRYMVPGTVRPEGFYGHLHNVYLQIAAERGIPVLLLLLGIIGKVMLDLAHAVKGAATKSDPAFRDRRALLHGAIAAILAILVGALFEHNLGDSEILMLFLVTVCLGYRVAAHTEVSDSLEFVKQRA
jgi:putative inorganic carbon (hco3(-)) transporter